MSFQTILGKLSSDTERMLARMWASTESGDLTQDEFIRLAANLIQVARSKGQAAAWLAFRAFLETHVGQVVPIDALGSDDQLTRLEDALRTITDAGGNTLARLARLARNEPVDAATTELSNRMADSRVSGWRRKLEPDACELCRWWSREGRVFQTSHKMPRHTGCTCHQQPVFNERTSNFQTTQQANDAARRTAAQSKGSK